ncbi:MAG: acyl-ACP--UDP-N-acetylglucosamine O-acyltransferase [Phycisphaerales bacterium]|nr:acyl-ACP--UDP-N-acetylglucosamine O-acyltransferase [Phycisphaerales bacterium]
MPQIHPMSVVDPGAQLADDIIVGPFAYIGPHVVLGKGCIVHHHAQIEGHTTAGENNEFFPNCVIGGVSQDLKYRGGACRVIIGNNNKFREFCTIHIGTEDGGGHTRIGDNNLIMVATHIAHDCNIASNTILANNVMLAGHVEVQDWVVISGGAASHHFVRFGQHAFVGGYAAIAHDVPPYMIVDGPEGKVRAVNTKGLSRRGYSEEQIASLKMAYRLLFKNPTPIITQTAELERLYPDNPEIQYLLAFMRESTNGKFGRARENLRGKTAWDEDDEPPTLVSGH